MPLASPPAPWGSAGARRRPPDHARPDRGERERPRRRGNACGRAWRATAGAPRAAGARPQPGPARAAEGGPLRPRPGHNAAGQPRDRLHALRRALRPGLRRLAVRRLRTRRSRKVPGRLDRDGCSEFAPSVWLGAVAFARSGPGRCNGLYIVRRETSCAGSTAACRPRPTCAAAGSPTCFIPPGDTTPQPDPRPRRARRALARRGHRLRGRGRELSRSAARCSTGRYIHWLQEDRDPQRVLRGPALARSASSVLEFTQPHVPRRVELARDPRAERFYYTNGKGLYLATDPPPIFAARGLT